MEKNELIRSVALLTLARLTVSTLKKSDLSDEQAEEVIALIDIDSFCDLIESIYYEYLNIPESANKVDPEEYFLAKIPEQVRIWKQTNIEPLVDAIKEGY